MQTDRHIPPQSLESEMGVLGSILVNHDAIDVALGIISQDDFYREAHRKIFQGLMHLTGKNEPCDLITMQGYFKRVGELEEIGGAAYLATLIDYVPSACSIAYYSREVAEKALERRLLQNAKEVELMIYGGSTSSEVIEKLESDIAQTVTKGGSDPVAAPQLITESARRLKSRYNNKGKLHGLSWGIDALDKATNGMHRGELIVVAGRPSMGKSAFAGNVIRSVCVANLHSMLFSLEMSRNDITDRFIADRGNIKLHHLRNGQLTDHEWRNHSVTCDEIMGWKLLIDDTPGVTLHDIRSKAKRQKRAGLDLLVVDYLQLISVPSKESRVQTMGEISRGLKKLARELDVPVILLSQLNRSVDGRPDKRPLMSDLRDSGEIEQDADVILFPYRPSSYCQKCRDRVDTDEHNLWEHQAKSEIIIEKQRNGERNISIPTVWLGAFQRFEGVS
jgi:replicative DNA helicase